MDVTTALGQPPPPKRISKHRTTIHVLSHEILCIAFSFLDLLDLFRCSCVCKSWYLSLSLSIFRDKSRHRSENERKLFLYFVSFWYFVRHLGRGPKSSHREIASHPKLSCWRQSIRNYGYWYSNTIWHLNSFWISMSKTWLTYILQSIGAYLFLKF